MSERESPTNDPEADADLRVLAMLQSGAPANGIDLAPWWRANAASLAAPPKPKSVSLPTWASFAAVFFVGVALGFAGSSGLFASPSFGESTKTCRYSDKEREAFVALVDAIDKVNGPDSPTRRTALVTLCKGCHPGRAEKGDDGVSVDAIEKVNGADWAPNRTAPVTLCESQTGGRVDPSL